MQWFGKPVPHNRFLGLVDQDDPTNLPMGLASLCRNKDFTRDSGGPTCVTTRAGHNTTMQCVDKNAPVTGLLGFVYQAETSTDESFQLPLAFQPTVGSQYESPVGSGRMAKFPQTNFTEPQGAHAIQASIGNKVVTAYSDLKVPLSAMSSMDPKAKTLNPFGLKPVGFNWLPSQPVLAGEICCPSPITGNGHTYQAQNSGVTAAGNEPTWPTGDGSTVIDNPGPNQIVWKERTMVIANRLPPPIAPTLAIAGGGTFGPDQDVYIVTTLLNPSGESLPSTPVMIEAVSGSSSVDVQLPTLAQLPAWISDTGAYLPTAMKIYVAVVAHAAAAPALSSYLGDGGGYAFGQLVPVTSVGTFPAPVTCTARVTPGQLPTPTALPNIQRIAEGTTVNPPAAPSLSLTAGSIGSGETVTLALTLLNANGETTLGGSNSITTTAPSQGVEIALASNYGPTVTGVNVYLYWEPIGHPLGWYLVNTSPLALGSTYVMTTATSATTTNPPVTNGATITGGTFASGRDVYVAYTYTNASGETPLGPANTVINTNPNDAILVSVAVPLGPGNVQLYSISSVGVYEADVPTGTAAPSPSAFSLVGYYQPNTYPIILDTATGQNPPTTNTTGPGGAIAADSLTGGPNGTQGYRYAACMFINQNGTYSGFSQASVVQTIIDEDGWEIGAFLIPTGSPNVIGRIIPFTIADASQAGPFDWIGNVNLIEPSQNVVYPTRTLIDQVEQSATVILDNVTTAAIFNFTDDYLDAENNVDDRLDIAIPPVGVRVDYLPSVDRLVVTGVPGLTGGAWISLAGDYESFYSDLSPVSISAGGQRCFGVTDKYKGIPFALMEDGGYVLEANTGNPQAWVPRKRWGKDEPGKDIGPCGFRAHDANGKMIVFVHRSGIYKYSEDDPDLMTKEVPKLWATINWAAGETIDLTIDEDTHTLIILVPTGASMVPNKKIVLSYIEGWNNPIHFSTFAGKEISMDAARRFSDHDLAAFLTVRMNRQLPPGGNPFMDGPTFETLQTSAFMQNQLLFASSSPDGTVQARTPGVFSDNGSGIDDPYETMSDGQMQAVCKPEGLNLNAVGQGLLNVSFLATRAQVNDQGGEPELIRELLEVPCAPVPLSPKQETGITLKVEPAISEYWRVRLKTDGLPGSWCSFKAMTVYVIPLTPGRDSGDQ